MSAFITISLNNALFHAHHGVFPQERQIGNEFSVSVKVSYPCRFPFSKTMTDNIADTISYADIHELIKKVMQTPRDLLETVCAEIADALLLQWPAIVHFDVCVTKVAPPIPGSSCSASAAISWSK